MNLNLHIKWDACNFLQCTFFKSIITIFSFTDIFSLVDIFSISNVLWNVHKFLLSFWLTLTLTWANVRNICKIFEVVPIEVHLLSEGISNKISKKFEVTFVPDKEMGVYEHKIQYIAKKCFKPKHTPSRCVFLSDRFSPIRGDYAPDYQLP